MNEKIIFHFLFSSNFTFFLFSPPLEHILTWNLGEVSIPNYVWMVHYGINCPSRFSPPSTSLWTWPAASNGRSSSSRQWRAARDGSKRQGEREKSDAHSGEVDDER